MKGPSKRRGLCCQTYSYHHDAVGYGDYNVNGKEPVSQPCVLFATAQQEHDHRQVEHCEDRVDYQKHYSSNIHHLRRSVDIRAVVAHVVFKADVSRCSKVHSCEVAFKKHKCTLFPDVLPKRAVSRGLREAVVYPARVTLSDWTCYIRRQSSILDFDFFRSSWDGPEKNRSIAGLSTFFGAVPKFWELKKLIEQRPFCRSSETIGCFRRKAN